MARNVTIVRERLVRLVDEVLAHYHSLDASAMSTPDQTALGDLVDALDRLAAGTYGCCIGCGARVGPEHLLEHPTASMCDNCALEDSWRPFGPR